MTNESKRTDVTAWSLWRRNGLIWLALMALLFLSLFLAYVPMGWVTPAVGIAIAVVKTSLVALLFMELVKSTTLIRLTAISGVVFIFALFALTLADVLARP